MYSGTGVIRDTNRAGFVWEVYPDLTPHPSTNSGIPDKLLTLTHTKLGIPESHRHYRWQQHTTPNTSPYYLVNFAVRAYPFQISRNSRLCTKQANSLGILSAARSLKSTLSSNSVLLPSLHNSFSSQLHHPQFLKYCTNS